MNAFISSDYIDHAELGKNNVMQYAMLDPAASFPDFPKDYVRTTIYLLDHNRQYFHLQ